MKKVIKLNESDLEKIVERVISDELPTEYKDFTSSDDISEEQMDSEPEPVMTDTDVEGPIGNQDRVPTNQNRFTVAKDKKGTYYILNQQTGQILAKK